MFYVLLKTGFAVLTKSSGPASVSVKCMIANVKDVLLCHESGILKKYAVNMLFIVFYATEKNLPME